MLGYAANKLLPVRLGEVVRALSGAHLAGAPLGVVAASLVVKRMLDGLVMLSFVFLVLLALVSTPQTGGLSLASLRAAAWALLAACLA